MVNVPELVFANLDVDFGRTEGDEEIQDLLKGSEGLNLGLHYLSGAIAYDPSVKIDPLLASKIVWLDAFITNIDRTRRNTNLLNWNKELWLIDHGAALYFHHNWESWEAQIPKTFPAIKDNVLLERATELTEAATEIQSQLTTELLQAIVGTVPDDWLTNPGLEVAPAQQREVYVALLDAKVRNLPAHVKEAKDARKARL